MSTHTTSYNKIGMTTGMVEVIFSKVFQNALLDYTFSCSLHTMPYEKLKNANFRLSGHGIGQPR